MHCYTIDWRKALIRRCSPIATHVFRCRAHASPTKREGQPDFGRRMIYPKAECLGSFLFLGLGGIDELDAEVRQP